MLRKFLIAASMAISMLGFFTPGTAAAAECSMYEQSHPNFTLTGAHLSTGKCSTCASCHKVGVFLGTPKTCVACHDGAAAYGNVRSTAHIPTGVLSCDSCHNTGSFTTSWSMNHAAVTNISCTSCHGGSYASVYNAQAKPMNHVPTTADCGTCHSTPSIGSSFPVTAWDTVSHDSIHAGITSGCVTCHDNVIAKGKAWYAPGHPEPTSNNCEQCHSTGAAFKCAQAYDIMKNYASMYYNKAYALVKQLFA